MKPLKPWKPATILVSLIKITSYHVIVGALALALVTTFRAIKEDHGLQVMDQVKVDFYTFLSIAMQDEGTVKREDLN